MTAAFDKHASDFAADGLIQLHWQYYKDPSVTMMVAQGGEFATAEEMHEWIQLMISEKGGGCPEGFGPMICDSTSDYFLWAAPGPMEQGSKER